MHALLLLFGTPIFVFDEHLQLLQAFEPDAEKRRPPSQEGEIHTPFRLMWHGKLGHYTSVSKPERELTNAHFMSTCYSQCRNFGGIRVAQGSWQDREGQRCLWQQFDRECASGYVVIGCLPARKHVQWC